MNKFLKITIASTLLLGGFLFAGAQSSTSTPERIVFPVMELGNCASQVECRAYCNRPENIEACTAFAEEHKLITRAEGEKNKKFSSALKNGGPGGCRDAEACKTYCENTEHADECVAFAEKHQLLSKEDGERAKNLNKIIRTQKGPGGCSSPSACKTYCDNPDNQQACLDFAQANGFIKTEDATRLRNFMSLQSSGQTPGACKNKEACEAYCHNQAHNQECLEFAVRIGAVTSEQAEKIKTSGRKGPGGCEGKEACEAYCNEESQQQECLQFAQDRGFVKPQEVRDIKEGQASARVGVKNMPAEVKECLEVKLDLETIAQIENGKFTPSAELSLGIKECFEKFRPQIKQELEQKFKANPEIETCLKETVGEEILSEVKSGQAPASKELGEKMRSCLERSSRPPKSGQSESGQAGKALQSNMIKECLGKALGEDALSNVDTANLTLEAKAAIEKCRVQAEGKIKPLPAPVQTDSNRIKNCLLEKLGSDAVKKIQDPAQRETDEVRSAMKACGYLQANTPKPLPAKPEQADSNKIKTCLIEKLGQDAVKKILDPKLRNSEEVQAAMKGCGYNQTPKP